MGSLAPYWSHWSSWTKRCISFGGECKLIFPSILHSLITNVTCASGPILQYIHWGSTSNWHTLKKQPLLCGTPASDVEKHSPSSTDWIVTSRVMRTWETGSANIVQRHSTIKRLGTISFFPSLYGCLFLSLSGFFCLFYFSLLFYCFWYTSQIKEKFIILTIGKPRDLD